MSVRAGLIGFGLAGRLLHAPLIKAAGLEITAIVTSRADHAREDFPHAAVLATPEELVARDDVDVVIVVTPDHLHAAHAALALDAGKHVVVDKPFTPTSAEALALIARAEAAGRMLTVYQNRRWDTDFLTVQKVIASGALGEIMFYGSRWDRYRPEARGTWHDAHMLGELFGLGPHMIDQAITLFGPPDWLMADVYNQRGVAGLNDGFEIVMGKGSLRMSIGCNLMAADEYKAHRVLGTKGAFTKPGLDPQEPRLRARAGVDAADFGVDPEANWGVLTDGASLSGTRVPSERGMWVDYYRRVKAAVETGAAPPVDPRDAARVIALLEAVVESASAGKRIDVTAFLAARGV